MQQSFENVISITKLVQQSFENVISITKLLVGARLLLYGKMPSRGPRAIYLAGVNSLAQGCLRAIYLAGVNSLAWALSFASRTRSCSSPGVAPSLRSLDTSRGSFDVRLPAPTVRYSLAWTCGAIYVLYKCKSAAGA